MSRLLATVVLVSAPVVLGGCGFFAAALVAFDEEAAEDKPTAVATAAPPRVATAATARAIPSATATGGGTTTAATTTPSVKKLASATAPTASSASAPQPKPTPAAARAIVLTDASFDAEVLSASVPVLVDFSASWCKACKDLDAAIEDLAADGSPKYKIAKVDIDAAPGVTQKYRVRAVPTVIVFENGKVATQRVGSATKAQLLAMLGG